MDRRLVLVIMHMLTPVHHLQILQWPCQQKNWTMDHFLCHVESHRWVYYFLGKKSSRMQYEKKGKPAEIVSRPGQRFSWETLGLDHHVEFDMYHWPKHCCTPCTLLFVKGIPWWQRYTRQYPPSQSAVYFQLSFPTLLALPWSLPKVLSSVSIIFLTNQ